MTTDAVQRPRISLLVAVARNGVIGAAGGMPWHLPEDLKRFKRLTTGHAIVMGRRTFESIGKPLPGRRNLVVSTTLSSSPGVEVFPSLEDAIHAARATDPLPFVIGGARLYREALPRATDLHVTWVDAPPVERADTFFPDPAFASPRGDFEESDREIAATPGLRFVHYRRRPISSI